MENLWSRKKSHLPRNDTNSINRMRRVSLLSISAVGFLSLSLSLYCSFLVSTSVYFPFFSFSISSP